MRVPKRKAARRIPTPTRMECWSIANITEHNSFMWRLLEQRKACFHGKNKQTENVTHLCVRQGPHNLRLRICHF